MSSKVSGWAWEQDIPAQRKCVLLWLAERATENGVCFPGQDEIRRKTRPQREHGAPLPALGLPAITMATINPSRHSCASSSDPLPAPETHRTSMCCSFPGRQPAGVRRELEELQHVPRAALRGGGWHRMHPRGVGGMHAPQWVSPAHPRWVAPATGKNRQLPDRHRESLTERRLQQGHGQDMTARRRFRARRNHHGMQTQLRRSPTRFIAGLARGPGP